MESHISLNGEQGRIEIEILAYENPSAANQDDANWLATKLRVEAGPFLGSFKMAFTTHDLISLRDQLKKALTSLSGAVSFQNLEDDISINIEFDKRGGARVSGVASPHGSKSAALHFQFDTDQSVLGRTVQELGIVLRQFPVKAL